MAKKKYEASDLWGSVITTCEIDCTAPGCEENCTLHGIDEHDALEEFFKLGWRCTGQHTYCPKHAKQKLKK